MTSQHQHGSTHRDHAAHSTISSAEWVDLAELLDLDAEVLNGYHQDVWSWVEQQTTKPPRRILDLGAGTGTGTIALARLFPGAEVIALDGSPDFLSLVQGKAETLGLTDQVHPLHADLDQGWPELADLDLAWASMSMHHLADPDRVLTDLLAALTPGGQLVVAEMDGQPRLLPEDLGVGAPGLENRCRAAVTQQRAAALPELGADWRARLSQAGFVDVVEQAFVVDLAGPLPPAAGRYAQLSLQRQRAGLDGLISAEDLATLDLLIADDGPASVRQRSDLHIRTTRTLSVGRRR